MRVHLIIVHKGFPQTVANPAKKNRKIVKIRGKNLESVAKKLFPEVKKNQEIERTAKKSRKHLIM